jgi:hypothetical protein
VVTRKALAAVVLVTGVGIGVWLGLVKPEALQQQRLTQTQAVLAEQLDGDLASAQQLNDRRKEVEALHERLCEQVSTDHMPRDAVQMMGLVTDLASSSGVSRPVLLLGKEEASPFDCGVGLVQTHISVSGQATLEQARTLFDKLENQRFFLRPADIRWDDRGRDAGMARMTIDVVYTQFRTPR